LAVVIAANEKLVAMQILDLPRRRQRNNEKFTAKFFVKRYSWWFLDKNMSKKKGRSEDRPFKTLVTKELLFYNQATFGGN
jgi:hypothetical protein